MNGISFHTARGQRITNVEVSRAQTQEEIDKSNEANKQAQDAAEQDDDRSDFEPPYDADSRQGGARKDSRDDPSLKTAQLRFTLFGGETAVVAADKLSFKGAAKGRAIDNDTGLPTIQIGNDGALNKPGSHRVDQAASLSDWLVQWFDWEKDEVRWAVMDGATLHTVTRRGLN